MKQALRFTNRRQVTLIFCVLIVLVGLYRIASVVNSQNVVAVETAYSVQIADAGAQGSDSLKRYGALKVAADESASNPRVALAADFDADGVQDLLVAHNDRLVLHRGNINAFAPQTEEAWEAIRDGRFVSPFERKTRSTSVPAAADFIFSGDFNRDAKLDVAFASRGDNILYVLEGDGAGNFPNLRRIETAGAITSLAAGDVNRADGLTDLIVGTRNQEGFALQVYSGLGDIFLVEPLVYNLPSQAETIAVGQLNENEFADIAIGTDSEVIILPGKDSTKTDNEQIPEMLRLSQPAGVKSIVTGDLMPDRDNRTELGVLSPDGTLRILARGALDTRPIGVNEHLAEQVREYQAKGYPIPQRILARLSKEDLRKPRLRPQGDVTTWTEAEAVMTAAPNSQLSSQSVLTTGRISGGAADDLIVLDQSSSKVLVMPFQMDYSKIDRQNTHLSFEGKRAMQDFDADGSPVAALALKLNYDNDLDLLVLKEGSGEPSAIVSAPQSTTFTVTTAVDDIDNNLGNGICNGPSGCTLRAAIMEANRLAGDDTIMINAGINPIISRGQPDNDGAVSFNDQSTGDLDITCVISNPASGGCDFPKPTTAANQNDLVIMGAAGGNTVSAGTFTPFPVNGGGTINTDRVFDVGQSGIFGGGFGGDTGVSATFTNLTIQNGNVREALNTAQGAGNFAFGGGIRYDGFGLAATHGSLTLMNTTITNNQSDNAGGGIYHVYGAHTAGSLTMYSNNITKAGEGGGLFFGAATSNSNVSITNSTFIGNEARQGTIYPGTSSEQFTGNADGGGLRINADPNTVTINNTNFTNNIAQQDGGAIKTLGALVTVTGGTMTGNTARRHGGVAFGDEDTANSPAFVTFSGSTMRNNTANSDNTIFPGPSGQPQFNDGAAGDGGAIFRDRGTLNIINCIIGGTGAGEPNTANNGGGVAHAFTVDSAAGNDSNQTIVTINGGSINGNIANTDGGGVYFNAALFDTTASTLNIGQTTATALTDNKAKNNGGGINVSNAATANLKDMVLRSNQANSDNSGGGDGGALYQNTGTTTFSGTTLTVGGSGFANSGVNGGGIRNNAGTVNITATNDSITHNTATGTGGGISNAGTLGALTTTTITNNTATGAGGGLHNTGTVGALTTPTITNNIATGNGGGIFNSGTLGAISTPTLNSNSGANGGGIYTSNGILTVTNGTINSNTATAAAGGGGILYAGSGASTVTGASINGNTGSGIYITANALDITNTIINSNSADGISKTGTGTGSELISGNTISGNGSLGIDLSDNGVTPNDAAGDADTGPNNLQNYPVINFVRRGDGIGNVTLNSTASRNFRINFFANTACDSSGNGEGEVALGTQNVTTNASGTVTFTTAALAFGAREQITATATDTVTGDTSEFSACRQVNRLPTFGTAQIISRQQGALTGNNGLIATVADLDQAANTLPVTVNGGASATVNGVTVSGIAIDASGNVAATVAATCTATNATFALRVTDTPGEFNDQTLTVNVTPNTPPTLGTYPNTTVNASSSGMVVTPNAAPTDNGTVATLTAAAPGFTGTFVGNTTTGTVTVNSAGPFGVYTVTVTATDNCGATTTGTFTLTVNAIPTIAAQAGLTRQQGTAVSNSQIATVNDDDQTENTLVVTVRAVGGVAPGTGTATVNGVTVSNIAVSAAGVVTADVVAACGATTPANFTLRVTDSNGAFTEATLSVAVTLNTAPTVGTYSNTNLTSGGGTTVSPTAAPADNGSIASATAAAPGFTGTLAVNSTTGVVTIANANPGGTYTVTVTFTDNCGTATTRQFTLTVSFTISGTVFYGTNPVGDPAKFVPGVTLNAAGTPPASTNTDANGIYTLSGLGAGPYTVTPSKATQAPPDNNGISMQDASEVAKYVFNQRTFTANELIAADATGNGTVSVQDASEIAKRSLNIASTNNIGQWKFVPATRTYPSITANLNGQNYDGILIGDVTGNWAPPAAASLSGAEKAENQADKIKASSAVTESETGGAVSASGSSTEINSPLATVTVSLPTTSGSANTTVLIPVTVGDLTGQNVTAYDFTVSFDPAILQPATPAFDTAGTLTAAAGGYTGLIDSLQPAGRVRIGAFGTTALSSSGTLIFMRFNVLSGAAATSPLNFVQFIFGEGRPQDAQAVTSNGSFMRLGPTAAMVSVGGQVRTAEGAGFAGVEVILQETASGQRRTAMTDEGGNFWFDDLEVGRDYIITPQKARYNFAPSSKLISLKEELTEINFTASSRSKKALR